MSEVKKFLKYPTGKIAPGAFCQCCMRYNTRNVTCSVLLVNKNEEILLVLRNSEPFKGRWALPGGYLDWYETVEQTAIREVSEETGLTVSALELAGIRSDLSAGDDRQNVDIFFFSRAFKGKLNSSSKEIKKTHWFSINSLPDKMAFDHKRIIKEFAYER